MSVRVPCPSELCRHTDGGVCRVLTLCRDVESLEEQAQADVTTRRTRRQADASR